MKRITLRQQTQSLSRLTWLLLLITLFSCGGGDDDRVASSGHGSGSGIGGSGIISTGSIDQFGSIHVNNVRFVSDGAAISLDGTAGSEQSLSEGMFVRIRGSVDEDGVNGVAQSVEYVTTLSGPLEQVSSTQGGVYNILTVLGKSVLIHPTETQFSGATFDTIRSAQWVMVSGRVISSSTQIATRVEVITPQPEESVLFRSSVLQQIEGTLTLADGFFADISGVSNAPSIAGGDIVEIRGSIEGTLITASSIAIRESFNQFDPIEPVAGTSQVIEGVISNFQNSASFNLAGADTNGANAAIEPSFYSLYEGLSIRAMGEFDSAQLVATQIYVQDILEEGTITSIDSDQNQITLQLQTHNQPLTFSVNDATQISDITGPTSLSLQFSDLNVGDLIQITLVHDASNQLIAEGVSLIAEFTGATSSDPAAVSEGNLLLIEAGESFSATEAVAVGSLSLENGSTLNMVLDSKEDGEYGRIGASGSIAAGGALVVSQSGIEFAVGDQFDLFNGTLAGTFNTVTLPELDRYRRWNSDQLFTTGVITVEGVTQPLLMTVDTQHGLTVGIRLHGTVNNVTIDWGDGTEAIANSAGVYTNRYDTVDEFTVSVSGELSAFGWDGGVVSSAIVAPITGVTQWNMVNGQDTLTELANAFLDHVNLVAVPDYLPTGVTDLTSMLLNCSSFNQDISSWDLSNVTSIRSLFQGATAFNQNIDSWNVSNVTNMLGLFLNAAAFNQSLNSWDVSKVLTMETMFSGATSFNGAIDQWNVANVNSMSSMFFQATAFNQDIGGWNVGSVTTMASAFLGATAFNQDISGWDVSNVTDMSGLFNQASAFNQPLNSWDVSSVTDMGSLFFQASAFNQPLADWNTANVQTMTSMFYQATAFNQPIGSWNTSSVTDMAGMFFQATAFDQPIDAWDVSSVTTLEVFLFGASLSTANYDNLLIGWNNQTLSSDVSFHAGNSTYTSGGAAESARTNMINSDGWMISDGGTN